MNRRSREGLRNLPKILFSIFQRRCPTQYDRCCARLQHAMPMYALSLLNPNVLYLNSSPRSSMLNFRFQSIRAQYQHILLTPLLVKYLIIAALNRIITPRLPLPRIQPLDWEILPQTTAVAVPCCPRSLRRTFMGATRSAICPAEIVG